MKKTKKDGIFPRGHLTRDQTKPNPRWGFYTSTLGLTLGDQTQKKKMLLSWRGVRRLVSFRLPWV